MFPKIVVSQKWMVKIMENPIKMDDLGSFPPNFGSTPIHPFVYLAPGRVISVGNAMALSTTFGGGKKNLSLPGGGIHTYGKTVRQF